MKKIVTNIIVIFCFFSILFFGSCGKNAVMVRFVQDGQKDIVKSVKVGETINSIPDPVQTDDGFIYEWNYDFEKPVNENSTITTIHYTKGLEFIFNKKRKTFSATVYNGTDTAVYFPDYYKGYSVDEIGQYILSAKSNVTFVKLPKNLITIGEKAFYHCKGLTQIDIPETVTRIDAFAFDNCSLSSINLPSGLTEITKRSLSNNKLKNLVIPEGVVRLGSFSLPNRYLEYIVLPKSLKKMDDGSIWGSRMDIYYCGTKDDWDLIDIFDEVTTENHGVTVKALLDSLNVYFYSKEEPQEKGNYWRYVGDNIVRWTF